jgi:hypothetical protein
MGSTPTCIQPSSYLEPLDKHFTKKGQYCNVLCNICASGAVWHRGDSGHFPAQSIPRLLQGQVQYVE